MQLGAGGGSNTFNKTRSTLQAIVDLWSQSDHIPKKSPCNTTTFLRRGRGNGLKVYPTNWDPCTIKSNPLRMRTANTKSRRGHALVRRKLLTRMSFSSLTVCVSGQNKSVWGGGRGEKYHFCTFTTILERREKGRGRGRGKGRKGLG